MQGNKLLRRGAVLIAVCAGILAGTQLVPIMQTVQIGAVTQDLPAEEEAGTSTPEEPSSVTLPVCTVPELQAGFSEAAVCGAIPWESAGSQAMHNARLYQNSGSGGGSIVRKQFGLHSGTQFFSLRGAGQVRNCTSWTNDALKAESEKPHALRLPEDGEPAVLLYHTHTTESFPLAAADTYGKEFSFRTTEPDKNMVAVGDAIAAALEEEGIRTVHSAEIHDYPKWNGSYDNSAKTIKAILEQYPSICVVLDIHRDAISSGSTVTAPVCTVEGKSAAQIMIISGCDNGNLNMPDYRENFHFACALQRTAETMFPGLTRPILFDYRKYNQDLTHGSLLIEVGSQGNSLAEACYAGELTGKAIAQTLKAESSSST